MAIASHEIENTELDRILSEYLRDNEVMFSIEAKIEDEQVGVSVVRRGASKVLVAILSGAMLTDEETYLLLKSVVSSYEATVILNAVTNHTHSDRLDTILDINREIKNRLAVAGITPDMIYGTEPLPVT